MAGAIALLVRHQESPLHCEENQLALRHLREVEKLMKLRDIDRTVRGVKGTPNR